MIEIKGERELIQIDITQFNTEKQQWGEGNSINCDIYFQKLESKFASKNVVISYDALKQFHSGLQLLIANEEGDTVLKDQNDAILLKGEIDKDPYRSVIVAEGNIYLLSFKFDYCKDSDISLNGYLFSN